MKISIVTPSYNQARFLEKALLSVWTQQGDFDLEHIVADGGSTDGSVELLKKYARLFRTGEFNHSCRSFTFHWWSCKDNGQSDALNKGFTASTGEIIGWLNSDDTYINPKSLSALLQPFLDEKTDIVIGNGYHIDEEDNVLDIPCLISKLDNSEFQQRIETLPCYNFILQPATLFRRSVWQGCPLDEKYHYIMDWAFWIEAQQKGFRFFKINDFTATNRLHGDAKTVEGGINKYKEGLVLFRRHNTWCLNRIYYFVYLILLRSKKIPPLNYLISSLIIIGKKTRNIFVNRFKLY
jgi:glycosyltransferase involved in cell wall biosynthesis